MTDNWHRYNLEGVWYYFPKVGVNPDDMAKWIYCKTHLKYEERWICDNPVDEDGTDDY